MTLVYNNDNGALQQVQFGVNEVLSALVLGKAVGSLVTRQNDAAIFRHLHNACHVRVIDTPKWLRNVQFRRATSIYGSNMRFVQGREAQLMGDVSINSLEGFAAMIVLSYRYAEPIDGIIDAVESLILGRLTRNVYPGDLEGAQSKLYASWKPLLRTWVQAVKSSDADSLQSSKTTEWLTELAAEGASVKLSSTFARARHLNLDLVADLLGEKDTRAGHWGEEVLTANGERVKQRVYDTMSTGTASIGLAAAANGADVSILCLTRNGSKIIPSTSDNPTQYLIRLWLIQPPPDIYQNLLSDENAEGHHANHFARNIVYGGEKEIALSIAQELDYWDGDKDGVQQVLSLWEMGMDAGKSMVWFVKPFQALSEIEDTVTTSPQLRLQIKLRDFKELPGLHVDELAKSIPQFMFPHGQGSRTTVLKPLYREIARIIHQEYQLSEYVKCPQRERDVFRAASNFVRIAIVLGSLHTLTRHADSSSTAYAFNLDTINIRSNARVQNSEFEQLLREAMAYGVAHTTILWAAAQIWGGASLASQGNTPINDHVLGIVAPQCSVILDFIRDPLQLARHGLEKPLISIFRGAAPLLGRDPSNGYVTARATSKYRPSVALDCHAIVPAPKRTPPPEVGDLLITFEAGFGGAITDNLFLAWYKGDLAFELNPECVFKNLLVRRASQPTDSHNMRSPQAETLPYTLDIHELMEKRDIYIRNGPAVLLAGADYAWVVVAAGCMKEIGVVAISLGGLDLEKATRDDLVVHCKI